MAKTVEPLAKGNPWIRLFVLLLRSLGSGGGDEQGEKSGSKRGRWGEEMKQSEWGGREEI